MKTKYTEAAFILYPFFIRQGMGARDAFKKARSLVRFHLRPEKLPAAVAANRAESWMNS
jgi:hypothetical protein